MTQIQANPAIQNLASVPSNVNAELAQAQHELEERIGVVAAVRRGLGFFGWVLTGFGLINLFRRNKLRGAAEEIVVYTVHPSFYLWALIALGFIASAYVKHWPGSAVAWGWAYVLILLCTIVTLLFDVSTLKALLWGGIFCLVWIASKYLEDLKGMTILSGV